MYVRKGIKLLAFIFEQPSHKCLTGSLWFSVTVSELQYNCYAAFALFLLFHYIEFGVHAYLREHYQHTYEYRVNVFSNLYLCE